MLEERFGLGEWEEGGVGGEDAENCTFWLSFFVPLPLSGEGKVSTFTFYKNSLSRLGNGGYFSPAFPRCIFIIGDEYNLWNR